MPIKAGQITIDVSAGTAKFVTEIETAKAKLREFGASGAGSMRPTTAAIRAMEGNFANNNRAAASFINTVLGGGKLMQYAFPLVGGLAFAGMLEQVSAKTIAFFRGIQEAPGKIANAFRELNAPLEVTNDDLRVSNDRLANDIAKLTGKHPNNLALELDEARKNADKLGESIEKNIRQVAKLLKEEAVGGIRRFLGEAGTGDLSDMANTLEASAGKVTDEYSEKIAKATTLKEKDALRTEENTRLLNLYRAALEDVNKKISQGPGFSALGTAMAGVPTLQNDAARQSALTGLRRFLQDQVSGIQLSFQNDTLTDKKQSAETAHQGREVTLRLTHELAMAQAELASAQGLRADSLIKLEAEEKAEIDRLREEGQLTTANADLIHRAYNDKYVAAYLTEMRSMNQVIEEQKQRWEHLQVEAAKYSGEFLSDQIKEGKKDLEETAKAVGKLADEYVRLKNESTAAGVGHAVRMIGIRDESADPVKVLAAQQAVQREEIEQRYDKLLNKHLEPLEKANILKAKQLELDRLDYELEEKKAERRQKDMSDFFLEMQRASETAGHIEYTAAHSLLDGTSDQLAKLITGQKTSFGKMLQGVGDDMLKSSLKSGLQKGLGVLGAHIPGPIGEALKGMSGAGKHDGQSKATAFWVQIEGAGRSGGTGGGGGGSSESDDSDSTTKQIGRDVGSVIGGAITGGKNGVAAALQGIGSHMINRSIDKALDQFGGGLAGGGDVNPGSAYIVGEMGPELFTPRSAGSITSNKNLGGITVHNHIDARGADLGAANRISAALAQVRESAAVNGMRAGVEHHKRTPQKHGGK